MSKQRRTVGDFLKIPLPNGKFSYARILDKASYAVYNLITDEVIDVFEVARHNILFVLAVYKEAMTSGRWIVIGHLPLEESLIQLPMKFIQDELNAENFELYNPNTGEITPATRQDCIGLERAAVWEPYQVEERIVDHFEGRSNMWYEQMKPK